MRTPESWLFSSRACLWSPRAGGDDDDDDTAASEVSGDDDSSDDDSGDDDDGGGDEDACALVTADDAQALFGDEFEVQQAEDVSPSDLGSSCLYENVGGDELGNAGHLLQFRVYDGEQFYGEDLYEGEEELDIGVEGETVTAAEKRDEVVALAEQVADEM